MNRPRSEAYRVAPFGIRLVEREEEHAPKSDRMSRQLAPERRQLGHTAEEFSGCWQMLGGALLAYITYCSDDCLCLCGCAFLLPYGQCYYRKADAPGEWKAPWFELGRIFVLLHD